MKDHYFCEGNCRGVSDRPGVCQAEDCEKHSEELTHCDCDRLEHKTEEENH